MPFREWGVQTCFSYSWTPPPDRLGREGVSECSLPGLQDALRADESLVFSLLETSRRRNAGQEGARTWAWIPPGWHAPCYWVEATRDWLDGQQDELAHWHWHHENENSERYRSTPPCRDRPQADRSWQDGRIILWSEETVGCSQCLTWNAETRRWERNQRHQGVFQTWC